MNYTKKTDSLQVYGQMLIDTNDIVLHRFILYEIIELVGMDFKLATNSSFRTYDAMLTNLAIVLTTESNVELYRLFLSRLLYHHNTIGAIYG